MIDESGDLFFPRDRGEVAFSRVAAQDGAILIFVSVNDDGYEASGMLTIEQLEIALRYAKGENVGA